MTGKVYFVSAPGRIKIGYTKQPERRLRDLRHADMEKLTTIAVINGSRKTEQKLHAILSSYCIRGEWFEDCPQVRGVISKAVAGEYASHSEPVSEPAFEPAPSFANPTVFADCKRLADETLAAMRRGDNKHDIRARVSALIAVSEILTGNRTGD